MNAIIILIACLVGILSPSTTNISNSSAGNNSKNDTSRVVAAVISYQANKRGSMPDTAYIENGGLLREFLENGQDMTITSLKASGDDAKDVITVNLGKQCDGSTPSKRAFSASTLLSNGQRFCVDS